MKIGKIAPREKIQGQRVISLMIISDYNS